MFEALGFVVSLGPGEADDFSEEHFGELMAKSHVFGDGAALAREVDATAAIDASEIVASHALEGSGDGGGTDIEFFCKTGADGRLLLLEHFPDGFEVVFLRYAGLFAPQGNSLPA